LAEICLELAGVPLEWRLHLIERQNSVPEAKLLASEPVDPAWIPDQQRTLKAYPRIDPAFVSDGQALFATISKGKVGQEWQRLIGIHGSALRTSICVPPGGSAAHVPWELLTSGMTPLVLERPFIRTNTCALPDDHFKPVWPVRVLVINATNPNDNDLKAEEEIWKIREALRPAHHSFDLEVYDTASDREVTTAGILAAMGRWPDGPHILHFIGHSVPSQLKLYFASTNTYLPWSLAAIAAAALRFPQLRLVYINACRSNVTNGDPATPWSITDAFLKTAVAVVAMQADISGDAAKLCAGEFYRELADGQAVDDAFLAARRMLMADFDERSVELYSPVLTSRVAMPSVLQVGCRNFSVAKHTNWQTSLNENWTHFVNQHVARRNLISALCDPAPETRGVVVWGDSKVGKSWLVNWTSYAMALNGVQVHYVDASEATDWLDVIRTIRDGKAKLASPELDPEIRSEFNWKLNSLAEGKPPPPYVAGQQIADTAGAHPAIMASGKAINGFDVSVCEALVHALRQQARATPRVLILDNPSRPVTAILKRPLLDALADRTAAESVRVILCCRTDLWKIYQEQGLDFANWSKIAVGQIEARQIARLIRELLRLQFPLSARQNPQLYASVEQTLAEISDPRPLPAGDLYSLCSSFGRLRGFA
jgi:hypothetical protein